MGDGESEGLGGMEVHAFPAPLQASDTETVSLLIVTSP